MLPERCNFSLSLKREYVGDNANCTVHGDRSNIAKALIRTSLFTHFIFVLSFPHMSVPRALLNILLLTSDLFAAFFDVLNTGFRLTPYFCAAFLCIVIGIVLYESGPSPADVDDRIFGAGGTPVTIEFRDRGNGRRQESSTTMASPFTRAGGCIVVAETTSSSLMSTEHAGNLNPFVNRELT